MKKRIFTAALAVIAGVCILSGCNGNKTDDKTKETPTDNSSEMTSKIQQVKDDIFGGEGTESEYSITKAEAQKLIDEQSQIATSEQSGTTGIDVPKSKIKSDKTKKDSKNKKSNSSKNKNSSDFNLKDYDSDGDGWTDDWK